MGSEFQLKAGATDPAGLRAASHHLRDPLDALVWRELGAAA
jgi:hypothetical protein